MSTDSNLLDVGWGNTNSCADDCDCKLAATLLLTRFPLHPCHVMKEALYHSSTAPHNHTGQP